MGDHVFGAKKHAAKIYGHDLVPFLDCPFLNRYPLYNDACVVDEHIQLSVLFDYSLYAGDPILLLGHIEVNIVSVAAI
jgi:hypothetical protein